LCINTFLNLYKTKKNKESNDSTLPTSNKSKETKNKIDLKECKYK